MANLARVANAIAAPLLLAAGGGAWYVITQQLKEQHITVHPDSASLGGKPVAGPITAFEQAQVVGMHAQHMGGGRTFAEISEEFMKAQEDGDQAKADELGPTRETLMQANFVRASLFTSVLSYGVAALTMGLGVLAGVNALGSDD